jgi:hypothetical protein
MPAVGHIVREFVLKVGATAYECAVTQASLAPTQTKTEFDTACPDGHGVAFGKPYDVLTLSYNVSHEDGSLFTFLRANMGQTADVEYVTADGHAKYAGTVTIGTPTDDATVGNIETGTCDLTASGLLTRTTVTPATP